MDIVGFFRALQGDLIGMFVAALVLLGVYALAVIFLSFHRRDSALETAQMNFEVRKVIDRITLAIAALIVGGFLIHACSMASTNRTPRQDVDGSDVYKQMNH